MRFKCIPKGGARDVAKVRNEHQRMISRGRLRVPGHGALSPKIYRNVIRQRLKALPHLPADGGSQCGRQRLNGGFRLLVPQIRVQHDVSRR